MSLRQLLGNRRKWKLARNYYRKRGRVPDFDNPTDFSEKVMSDILYRRNDDFYRCADKVLVKDYVASKGLGHIVPKCYGVWDSASEIDWDALPDKFALKINHGCGYNLFCRDKSTFDRKAASAKLDYWLHKPYGFLETHYLKIEPKIFAEEFLDDMGNHPVDYRIYCFHGRPFVIDATICPNNDQLARFPHYIFDTDWNYMPQYSQRVYNDPERLPRPENFDQMLEYAHKLSEDFDMVRVDLYNFAGKIYFGELTFTPSRGSFAQFNDVALRDMYAQTKA